MYCKLPVITFSLALIFGRLYGIIVRGLSLSNKWDGGWLSCSTRTCLIWFLYRWYWGWLRIKRWCWRSRSLRRSSWSCICASIWWFGRIRCIISLFWLCRWRWWLWWCRRYLTKPYKTNNIVVRQLVILRICGMQFAPDAAIDSNDEIGVRDDGEGDAWTFVACFWIGGGDSGNCCESRGDSGNCCESSSIEPAPWAWLWWYFKPFACLYFLLQSGETNKTNSLVRLCFALFSKKICNVNYWPCSGHSNKTGEIAHGVVVFTFFEGICTFRSDCKMKHDKN